MSVKSIWDICDRIESVLSGEVINLSAQAIVTIANRVEARENNKEQKSKVALLKNCIPTIVH